MPQIDGVKMAWYGFPTRNKSPCSLLLELPSDHGTSEPCIRGHRAPTCQHAEKRRMFPVRKPGRPARDPAQPPVTNMPAGRSFYPQGNAHAVAGSRSPPSTQEYDASLNESLSLSADARFINRQSTRERNPVPPCLLPLTEPAPLDDEVSVAGPLCELGSQHPELDGWLENLAAGTQTGDIDSLDQRALSRTDLYPSTSDTMYRCAQVPTAHLSTHFTALDPQVLLESTQEELSADKLPSGYFPYPISWQQLRVGPGGDLYVLLPDGS